ncbi:MAG TPA: hypothetical protein PKA41_08510 [Verrucomicrobiota bacterium]|nr:hypothetical protein [Verrucomicrobiota bacterium]
MVLNVCGAGEIFLEEQKLQFPNPWSGSSNSVAASNREGARASALLNVDLQVDDEAA